MPLQFTTIEEPTFARGIDARSAENQIQAGFAKDLVNVDIVEARIRKRRGYHSHAGQIPVRVRQMTQVTGELRFVLDSSIDLARISSGPIMVYGKSGAVTSGNGPFTVDGNNVRYYDNWASNLRKTFLLGSNSFTVLQTEHNIPTDQMFVGLSLSSEGETLSGENTFSQAVKVSKGTPANISVDYVNSTGVTQSVFLYYRDQQPVIGKSYTHPFSVAAESSAPVTVSAATHGLDNYSIVYQLYEDDGTDLIQIKPDEFTVDADSGLVSVTVNNTYLVPKTFRLILASVPLAQTKTSISTALPQSYTIQNIESPFLFYTLYLRTGNILQEVIPDTLSFNDSTKELILEWNGPQGGTLEFYYEYGSVRANELRVVDATAVGSSVDLAPQLSIYGLDHALLYGNDKKVNRRGWVNHLDSYRSPLTTHVVAGLGGNLFAALDTNPPGITTTLMPTRYPRLNARVSGAQVMGPAFYDPSAVPQDPNRERTRGYYTFVGGLFHWAVVTEVRYVSSTGYTEYTLSTRSRVKTGTPVEAGDILTVEKMSHSRHSGNFEIVSIDDTSPTTLVVTVKNPKLTTDDYNDFDTEGRAGIFSDRVTLQGDSPFVAGDILLSSSWDSTAGIIVGSIPAATVTVDGTNITTIQVDSTLKFPATGTVLLNQVAINYSAVTSTSITLVSPVTVKAQDKLEYQGTQLWVTQCYNYQVLNSGLVVTGKRKSATVPLRDIGPSAGNISRIVPGDVLSFSELERELTVVSVDPVKKTVTLDEEIEWYDDLSLPPSFTVARRWYPVETPIRNDEDTLLPLTTVQHFSAAPYDNQAFLRSAMVLNNMYLTNGEDEVYKYDGANLYRAGIIPWQPGLFVAIENIGSGGIKLPAIEVSAGLALLGSSIEMNTSDASQFAQNDIVQVKFSSLAEPLTLTVAEIKDATTASKKLLSFKETLSIVSTDPVPTVSTIKGCYLATYYFRLNIKDQRGVTTAGAVSGDDSFKVLLVPSKNSGQRVLLRLVGLPAWDQYDYRNGNIELQIYRTPWSKGSIGEVSLGYKLLTIPLTFIPNDGYIDFIDTYSNDTLFETDVVTGVLSPNTIPVDWDEPVRGKYVTTTGNRLVLANVKSWPTFTVDYLTNKDTNYSSFAGQKFTFYRDASLSFTNTNMLSHVRYELREASNAKTIYPVIGSTGHFKFSSPAGFAGVTPGSAEVTPGSWVYLYHSTISNGNNLITTASVSTDKFTISGTIPDNTLVHFSSTGNYPQYGAGIPIEPGRGYFVTQSGSNEFKITSAYNSGTALDITNAGTGTLTVLWDGSELEYAGWYQVAQIESNVITVHRPGHNATTIPTQFPDKALFATDPRDVPVLLGIDGNMGMTNGNGPVPYLNVIRRLGMAINATMRATDTTLQSPDQKTFVPWLTAQSESFTGGTLIVRRPRADDVTPSLKITGGPLASTYLNNEPAPPEAVLADTTRYPSRVLLSYDSYPEIFSNPFSQDLSQTDSAVDINAADGQEITGIFTFFGSAAFGASQQTGVLVVFKSNSIYVVNPLTREVQKLETQGLGCTAPYSIASTKDGVAFANESGIYVLRRDLRIEYLGRFMERNWSERVDLDALSLAQGHHYGIGKQYKLSVPMTESSVGAYAENEEVYVYAYTAEADGAMGGWTRYTNHMATGWCNLFQDAFFADVNGNVQRIRNLGENSDYRDGSVAIESIIETRPTNFDQSAIRKAVNNVVVHYRANAVSESTTLGMATDMATEYQLSTAYKVVTTAATKNGISDQVGQYIQSIMHSFPRPRCLYAGVKITNNGLDENVEVAGIGYVVAGLSSSGIKQAAETKE